jgi:hypothetical protein
MYTAPLLTLSGQATRWSMGLHTDASAGSIEVPAKLTGPRPAVCRVHQKLERDNGHICNVQQVSR